METCLVTGGAGFIGSHLVTNLLADGWHVRVLDNLATGRIENLAHVRGEIELYEGDIRDAALVETAVRGAAVVFHQAALASVQRSIDNPLLTNDVNVNGTLNILQAARNAGVQRVVFASSSSVYGDTPTLPKIETMEVQPLSPYAVSKLAGERYCLVWSRVFGLPTIALRYFNVFGPRQDPRSDYAAVIPRFATALAQGRAPTIYGDGQQSRDFTYIANVVQANRAAAAAPASVSGYFNVATGARISLLELVERINDLLGSDIAPIHAEARAGDVRHSQASIAAIENAIGWKPHVAFAEGLQQTVAYYRQ